MSDDKTHVIEMASDVILLGSDN